MNPAIGAAIIGAAAAVIAAIVGARRHSDKSEALTASTQSPGNLGDLFLAGCGVGNAVAVLPVSFGDGPDTESLVELLAALRAIGLSEDDLAPLRRMLDVGLKVDGPSPSEGDKEAVSRYFETMRELPALVRARSSDSNFVWFRLGELLYASAVNVTLPAPPEREGQGDCAEPRALEFLAERSELPQGLREHIKQFVSHARAGSDFEEVYEEANTIARSVHSLIH